MVKIRPCNVADNIFNLVLLHFFRISTVAIIRNVFMWLRLTFIFLLLSTGVFAKTKRLFCEDVNMEIIAMSLPLRQTERLSRPLSGLKDHFCDHRLIRFSRHKDRQLEAV